MDKEAIARIIDPEEWYNRDRYVEIMTASGGCAVSTISEIAEKRVSDSLAKATAILALQSSERGEGECIVIPRTLFDFLMGTGEIDGTSFGELADGLPGRFWWRALLKTAEGQTLSPAEPSPESREGVPGPEGVTSLRELGLDHFHLEDWECTYNYDQLDLLNEEIVERKGDTGPIHEVFTLKTGPTLFAAMVPTDVDEAGDVHDEDLRLFASRDDAEAATRLRNPRSFGPRP